MLKSEAGHYVLNVRFTGYKDWNEQIQVSGNLTTPTVILEEDVQQLTEITIRDTPIRYRPDGYIVSMVNSPMAKDRTSIEVLNYLPEYNQYRSHSCFRRGFFRQFPLCYYQVNAEEITGRGWSFLCTIFCGRR